MHETLVPINWLDVSSYQFTHPLTIAKILSAIISPCLGLYVFSKNRRSPVHTSFLIYSIGLTIWLGTGALQELCQYPAMVVALLKFKHWAIVSIGPSLYFFSKALLGHHRKKNHWIALNFFLAFVAVLCTKYFLATEVRQYTWGMVAKNSPHYGWILFHLSTLIIISQLSYLRAYRTAPNSAIKNRMKYMFLAFGIASLGILEYLPVMGFNLYPLGGFAIL